MLSLLTGSVLKKTVGLIWVGNRLALIKADKTHSIYFSGPQVNAIKRVLGENASLPELKRWLLEKIVEAAPKDENASDGELEQTEVILDAGKPASSATE